MEDQIREALGQSLIREHQLTGIKLSRATTYITCKCGAEFTGPDWWTRHLVDETTKAVMEVAGKIRVDDSQSQVIVIHPPEGNESRWAPDLEVSPTGEVHRVGGSN